MIILFILQPVKGKKIPKGKKVAPTPAALLDAAGGSSSKKDQKEPEKAVNPLFEKRPRNSSKREYYLFIAHRFRFSR